MRIVDYLLEGAVIQIVAKNKRKFGISALDTIIIHYTASGSAASAISTLSDPQTGVSAHLVIARDGTITQLVPFDIEAWHAGKSKYGTKSDFNRLSIGIELENAGLLEKRGPKYYSWFGKEYVESEVVQAVHRNEYSPKYWHAYTEEQINVVEQVCKSLLESYNLKYVLGHEEISPGRKTDPGPAFPLDSLRERLFATPLSTTSGPDEFSHGIVRAEALNIRTRPEPNADLAAKALTKGHKVQIVEAKDGWYRVVTQVQGWVSAKYIDVKKE